MNYILCNYQDVIGTMGFCELPKQIIKEINMIVASHGVKVFVNRSDNNTR